MNFNENTFRSILFHEEQKQKMLEQIQSNGLHEYSPAERQNILVFLVQEITHYKTNKIGDLKWAF